MAKLCYFLSINKDWLNPFKCSETIGIYEGEWYMMLVCWTTDYRGWPTDYGSTEDDLDILEDAPKFVVSFKLTRIVWIHLNILKW